MVSISWDLVFQGFDFTIYSCNSTFHFSNLRMIREEENMLLKIYSNIYRRTLSIVFIIQIWFLTFLTLYKASSGLPSRPSYLLPGPIWLLPSLQATFPYLSLFILCHEPLSLNSPVCVTVSLDLFFRGGRVHN